MVVDEKCSRLLWFFSILSFEPSWSMKQLTEMMNALINCRFCLIV